MTLDDYDAMLAAQSGGCAICGTPPSVDGRALAVDHCHATGLVRGLLCRACNQGLGIFADDPQRLRKAANYLRRTR
jgi:hypothetical protein